MILRRITEHVKAQNWLAVGIDFVIVVVGVFVGLQVQEWSVDRAERRLERAAIERLIGDPEIPRLLNQWSTRAQAMIEWQEIERHHGEELILGLAYEYLAWPTIDKFVGGSEITSAMEGDYQGLLSSKRFEGVLQPLVQHARGHPPNGRTGG